MKAIVSLDHFREKKQGMLIFFLSCKHFLRKNKNLHGLYVLIIFLTSSVKSEGYSLYLSKLYSIFASKRKRYNYNLYFFIIVAFFLGIVVFGFWQVCGYEAKKILIAGWIQVKF